MARKFCNRRHICVDGIREDVLNVEFLHGADLCVDALVEWLQCRTASRLDTKSRFSCMIRELAYVTQRECRAMSGRTERDVLYHKLHKEYV